MKRKASSLEKVVLSMVSGAFGALIGNPFDVALIRRQASLSNNVNHYKSTFDAFRSILVNEGWLSLWRGLNITICRVIIINLGQLAGKDIISDKMSVFNWSTTTHQNLTALLASVLTAVISLPVDNIKVKLQKQDNSSESYRGILHCFSRSIANEGFIRLWVGFPIYLIRGAPHSFIIIRCQQLLTGEWKKISGEWGTKMRMIWIEKILICSIQYSKETNDVHSLIWRLVFLSSWFHRDSLHSNQANALNNFGDQFDSNNQYRIIFRKKDEWRRTVLVNKASSEGKETDSPPFPNSELRPEVLWTGTAEEIQPLHHIYQKNGHDHEKLHQTINLLQLPPTHPLPQRTQKQTFSPPIPHPPQTKLFQPASTIILGPRNVPPTTQQSSPVTHQYPTSSWRASDKGIGCSTR